MVRIILLVIIGIPGGSLVSYASDARFDPTRPPYYRDVEAKTIRKADLSVTAIIVSKKRRVAVVNDHVVKEGDEILGLKIIGIDKEKVRFYGHEGYFSIPLHVTVKQELSKEVENS